MRTALKQALGKFRSNLVVTTHAQTGPLDLFTTPCNFLPCFCRFSSFVYSHSCTSGVGHKEDRLTCNVLRQSSALSYNPASVRNPKSDRTHDASQALRSYNNSKAKQSINSQSRLVLYLTTLSFLDREMQNSDTLHRGHGPATAPHRPVHQHQT